MNLNYNPWKIKFSSSRIVSLSSVEKVTSTVCLYVTISRLWLFLLALGVTLCGWQDVKNPVANQRLISPI